MPIKRPGANRPTPVRRKPRKPNWIYIGGCVILMGVFFMPWFSTPAGSVLGYEIPYWTPRALAAYYAPAGIVLASNSLWAFAFVGVFAFFGLGMELAALQKHKNQWWLRLLTAISPFLAVGIIITSFSFANAHDLSQLAGDLNRAGVGGQQLAVGMGAIVIALLGASSWGLWLMGLAMTLCVVSVFVHPGRKPKGAPGKPDSPQGEPPPAA